MKTFKKAYCVIGGLFLDVFAVGAVMGVMASPNTELVINFNKKDNKPENTASKEETKE